MKTTITANPMLRFAALTIALAALPGLAMAAASKGEFVGKTEVEIADSLKQQGYEVRKIEEEDGYLEAYARLDGARFEIYVDPATGKIVKIEEDD